MRAGTYRRRRRAGRRPHRARHGRAVRGRHPDSASLSERRSRRHRRSGKRCLELAAQRGLGDVPGQGGRPEPVRDLRPARADRGRRGLRNRSRAAACPGEQGVQARLPATALVGGTACPRVRGADPLGAPPARDAQPRGLPRRRRGPRPDRADRRWVLDTACEQLAAWTADRDPNIASLTMSVNVSGRELRERHFVDLVRSTLEQHGLAPGQLCLEVSERALVYDGPDSRRTLEALAALGVQLAVDDFGATYTSLTRLPKFPVGVVKLEQLTVSSHERGIVAAVIAMAHGLGMSVVGGGIETVAQLNDLLDLACDDGQGFLLGRPLSIADVIQVIAADGATLRAEAATQHVSIDN
ncbi:EAL domain-containing protein [Cryobacterium glucosi]|uniref:EAL domain-containing protein n=1 Tax=Cryobacterium glucosi TaxID=1259175 RepID=A0ABY2IQB3_9MICO|nr:EAL domain-containing protein [Cryobacterium glucosi]